MKLWMLLELSPQVAWHGPAPKRVLTSIAWKFGDFKLITVGEYEHLRTVEPQPVETVYEIV
jgi:hypothetical protein